MSVVSIADAWPVTSRPFNVDDLDRMPDDGRRYELVDGILLVSPAHGVAHQIVVMALAAQLHESRPSGVRVLPGPGVRMSTDTELIPDIVVVRFEHIGGIRITNAPLLAVEVRSPSTALVDLNIKKAVYERFGVGSYWVVVPEVDRPELIAFDLRDGHYEQVAHVTGDQAFTATRPFPVEIVPAQLVAELLPD
jgi:Uma2 family endonuclease